MSTLACYLNHCIDSSKIMYSDKYHQIFFTGVSNMLITNPRWCTAAILKNGKFVISQERFD